MRPFVQLSVIPEGDRARVQIAVFDGDSLNDTRPIYGFQWLSTHVPPREAATLPLWLAEILTSAVRQVVLNTGASIDDVERLDQAYVVAMKLSESWRGRPPRSPAGGGQDV